MSVYVIYSVGAVVLAILVLVLIVQIKKNFNGNRSTESWSFLNEKPKFYTLPSSVIASH